MAQERSNREQDGNECRQHPQGPIPCSNNCGFFGTPSTMNLCSKCYRDVVLKQVRTSSAKNLEEKSMVSGLAEKCLTAGTQADSVGSLAPEQYESSIPSVEVVHREEQLLPTLVSVASSSGVSESADAVLQANLQSSPQGPNRCLTCRKRVGLTGFKCRCGDVFCALHRYPDKHNCSFDFKSTGRDAIAKANPVVKAEKIDRI